VAKLIYSAITSLDGYVADENGNFDWAEPDEEVHTFVNDLERPVGTYLYGRHMYKTMAVWEKVRPKLVRWSIPPRGGRPLRKKGSFSSSMTGKTFVGWSRTS